MQKPLILFVQWFGPWPEWIEFFIESCKWNRDVDWLVVTDQDPPENAAPNVRYRRMSFADHKAMLGDKIGLDLSAASPLKLCDLKPTLGFVFDDETAGYCNFGYCDIDLIFGDIRAFYTDAVLARYEVLSTHRHKLSGHLTVLRNSAANKVAFRRIRSWRRKASDPRNLGIDEGRFGKVFQRPPLWRRLAGRRVPCLFEEFYTTPLSGVPWIDGAATYPARWYWRDGKLTAEGAGAREFIYLHFMNWKAGTTRPIRGGSGPPWSGVERLVKMDWREAGAKGFMISHDGFAALPPLRRRPAA